MDSLATPLRRYVDITKRLTELNAKARELREERQSVELDLAAVYNEQRGEIPQKIALNQSKMLFLVKKPGEWNTFFIRMVGEKVSVWLNDTLVVDRVKLEDSWSKGTKRIPRADQIELQHHGSELFFKNIFLRELPW